MLLSDGRAALWCINAPREPGTHAVQATCVDDGTALLASVAAFNEAHSATTAFGTYPVVDVAPNGAIVVATSDFVVSVRAPETTDWRTLISICGLYYPIFSFSADGELGFALAEQTFAFTTRSPRALNLPRDFGVGAWHPSDPARAIRYERGELYGVDFRAFLAGADASSLRGQPLGPAPWRRTSAWSFQDDPDLLHWHPDGTILAATATHLYAARPGGPLLASHPLPELSGADPDGDYGFWEEIEGKGFVQRTLRDGAWAASMRIASPGAPKRSPDGRRAVVVQTPSASNPRPMTRPWETIAELGIVNVR
ncbi:MAG: hypothetical protein AAGE52_04085 [Myxococcota bacterium]